MTALQLTAERPIQPLSASQLQRLAGGTPEPLVAAPVSYYFHVVRFLRGRPVVREYDPAEWPYPPEPECQEEWDKTGE